MPGKLFCFWGSPSSGKSICALSVAAKLAEAKKNVFVLSCDRVIPMLKIYAPTVELNAKHSIGSLLMANKFDDSSLVTRMISHPESEYVCFLGLAPEDTYITYPAFGRSSIIKLINMLLASGDYVLVDGVSNPIDDILTLTCLELADKVIRIVTPDNKGILFLDAYKNIFQDDKFNFEKHLKILGNIKNISPVSETIHVLGDFDYYLPYSHEVESKFISGELIKNMKRTKGIEFEEEIKELVERLCNSEQ